MLRIFLRGSKHGLYVSWTLGKIIFPITIIVTILQFTPVLPLLVKVIAPIMQLIGLPGEAGLPLVLGNILNLYAAIGAIVTFDFTVKEVFIMAMMLSFSHNLFVESAVASRVGAKWWVLAAIRLILAFSSAFIINLVWKGGGQKAKYGLISSPDVILDSWREIILFGLKTGFISVLQLSLIILPLMIIVQYFRELGWLQYLSDIISPFTRFLGMSKNTSFTLVTGLTIGLAFGSGVMIQAVHEDNVSKKDIMLTLIFLVTCHSVVEDTVIFIPLGIPVWPLLVIRFFMAIIITLIVATAWRRFETKKRARLYSE